MRLTQGRRFTLDNGRAYALGKLLKSGGAGGIHLVDGAPELVAKVYHATVNLDEYEAKVAAMLRLAPDLPDRVELGQRMVQVAWPISTMHVDHRFCGFVMPKLDIAATIELEYVLQERQARAHDLPTGLGARVTLAANLGAVLAALHREHHYVVDLKPVNLRFYRRSLYLALLDCDGFSIQGEEAGERWHAPQVTPDYLAPEFHGRGFQHAEGADEEQQDRFALAVIVFQLLNFGLHPYAGRPVAAEVPTDIPGRIAGRFYAYGAKPHPGIAPSPVSGHALMPLELRHLFDRAFAGSAAQRPSARDWANALAPYAHRSSGQLVVCTADREHQHFAGYACAACARVALIAQAAQAQREVAASQGLGPSPHAAPAPSVTVVAAPASGRPRRRGGRPAVPAVPAVPVLPAPAAPVQVFVPSPARRFWNAALLFIPLPLLVLAGFLALWYPISRFAGKPQPAPVKSTASQRPSIESTKALLEKVMDAAARGDRTGHERALAAVKTENTLVRVDDPETWFAFAVQKLESNEDHAVGAFATALMRWTPFHRPFNAKHHVRTTTRFDEDARERLERIQLRSGDAALRLGFVRRSAAAPPVHFHGDAEPALASLDGEYADGKGLVPVCVDAHFKACGLLDRRGRWRVEPAYASIVENGSGWAVARVPRFVGLLDREGRVVAPPSFASIGPFRSGLAWAQSKRMRALYGFIDTNGRWVIAPRFAMASDFNGDAAVAQEADSSRGEGRLVLVRKDGTSTPLPYDRHDDGQNLGDGRFVVGTGALRGIIDSAGAVVFALQPAFDIQLVRSAGWVHGGPGSDGNPRVVVYDKAGKSLLELRGDAVIEPADADGHARFRHDGLMGVVNLVSGKVVIAASARELRDPSEGRVAFRDHGDSRYGYLDLQGRVVIPAAYLDGPPFRRGIAMSCGGKQCWAIDRSGRSVRATATAGASSLGQSFWGDAGNRLAVRDITTARIDRENVLVTAGGDVLARVQTDTECGRQRVLDAAGAVIWPRREHHESLCAAARSLRDSRGATQSIETAATYALKSEAGRFIEQTLLAQEQDALAEFFARDER